MDIELPRYGVTAPKHVKSLPYFPAHKTHFFPGKM